MSSNKINEINLFATSIFHTKIPSYGIFNQEFTKYIYDLKSKHPENISKSNEKGWHSPNLNLNDKPVTKFVKIIDPIIEKITEELMWDLDQYFIGYQSIWSIINDKYSYNLIHNHGDTLLSLAYYVKIPKDNKGGEIYFKDPRITSQQRKPPLIENTIKSKEKGNKTHGFSNGEIQPKEGDLLIFPGWLDHGVRQSMSDEDRIVISANIDLYAKPNKIKPGHHANYRN
jgi:uncharacterized protein (TIGR02466 family)